MIIENITSQIDLFATNVANEVEALKKDYSYTTDQAIEIVRIAVESMKAEDVHHVINDDRCEFKVKLRDF